MMKKMILLISVMVMLLMGCSKPEEITYQTFDHIDHWDQIHDLEEGIVIIYFYAPSCPVCIAIKDDVLMYAYQASKTHKIYFIDAGMIHEQGTPNFDIPPAPSLIILNDQVWVEFQNGPINVVTYLKNLNETK